MSHLLLNRDSNIVSTMFLPSASRLPSVCQGGQWQCSAERCAAQCNIIGAMHISTFDKKRYDLQTADCQFIAVEVRQF